MPFFRKKPVVIEAVRWEPDADGVPAGPWPIEWGDAPSRWNVYAKTFGAPNLAIPTLEGTIFASPGDWIIRGVKGGFYPCKPDIFAATYEPAPSSSTAPRAEPIWTTIACPNCGGEVDGIRVLTEAEIGRPAPPSQGETAAPRIIDASRVPTEGLAAFIATTRGSPAPAPRQPSEPQPNAALNLAHGLEADGRARQPSDTDTARCEGRDPPDGFRCDLAAGHEGRHRHVCADGTVYRWWGPSSSPSTATPEKP